MSEKTVITCDHCGIPVENTTKSRFPRVAYVNEAYDMQTIDGCSKEHLGLALAKAFGLPIDTKAADLFVEHAKSEAHRVFLETDVKRLEARIAELERQDRDAFTPNPISMMVDSWANPQKEWDAANGKTPGQVNYAAFRDGVMNHHEMDTVDEWEADALRRARARIEAAPVAAGACRIKEGALAIIDDEIAKLEAKPAGKAPECFLCGKGPHDHTMMVLESLPEQFEVKWCNGRRQNFGTEKPAWWDVPKSDHVHELKSCSFCDKQPPNTSAESGPLPDAVLTITLPTKPTKPLRERLEELAAYWYMGDKDDKELNGAYRLARQECAKELREVINDPR